MKKAIAKILLDEGYIKSFDLIEDGVKPPDQGCPEVCTGKQPVIKGTEAHLKPGCGVYAKSNELPTVLGGIIGIAIISTSKGVMSDKQARAAGIGGEVLAYIW